MQVRRIHLVLDELIAEENRDDEDASWDSALCLFWKRLPFPPQRVVVLDRHLPRRPAK